MRVVNEGGDSMVPLIRPQRGKLRLWGVILCIGAIELYFPGPLARLLGVHPGAVLFGAIGTLLLVMVGGSMSLRCPSCGLSLPWHAMAKEPLGAFPFWMTEVKVCPRCGFSHSLESTERN
jgi:hypothetical protein